MKLSIQLLSKLYKVALIFSVFCMVLGSVSPAFAQETTDIAPAIEPAPEITPAEKESVETIPTEEEEIIKPPIDPIEPSDKEEEPLEEDYAKVGTLNDETSMNRSALTAKVDDISGALIYEYPIALPPGRLDMTPDLSLKYNSQNASKLGSIAGLGWELTIPYIQREPVKGTNNLYSEAYFTSSISGSLLPSSDTSTSQFTTYNPETDDGSFIKYAYNSDNSWSMVAKDGKVYTFGSSTASRQDNPADSTKVYKWMLSKITDANGNEIQYSYIKDAGQIYPSQIIYTYHSSGGAMHAVNFAYTNPTNYGSTLYTSAFPVTTSKLLSGITISVVGGGGITYSFNYNDAQFIKQKLLASISHTPAGSQQSYNTLLTYSTKTPGWQQGTHSLANELPNMTGIMAATRYADFDSNGYSDVLVSKKEGNNPAYQKLFLNTGTAFNEVTSSWSLPSYEFTSNSSLVDLNGDHLPDLHQNYSTQLHVYLNNGSGFDVDTSGIWNIRNYIPTAICGPNDGIAQNSRTNTFLHDINYDGKNDIINFSGPNGFQVWLNNGNGFTQSNDYTFTAPPDVGYDNTSSCGFEGRYQTLIDLNGDGLLDYLHQMHGAFINTGSGFAYNSNYNVVFNTLNTTAIDDINGDGLVDYIVFMYHGDYVTKACTRVYLNTGTGFSMVNPTDTSQCNTTGVWQPNLLRFGLSDPGMFLDVTADGVPDIIGPYSGNAGRVRGINDAKNEWIVPTPESAWQPITNPGLTTFFDINNDEITDFITTVTNGTGNLSKVHIGKADVPNRLTQIRPPNKAVTNIEYGTANTDLQGIKVSLMPVVKKITIGNLGYGQPDMVTQYSYSGGHYVRHPISGQLKFAGYQKVTTTESGPDLVPLRIKDAYFHQGNASDSSNGEYEDHIAKIGRVYRAEIKDGNGNLYAKTLNKWDRSEIAPGRNFVKLAQTVELTYDGDSSHKDKVTSYDYDDTNGNITEQIDWGEVVGSANGTFTDTGNDKYTTTISYATGGSYEVEGLPAVETVVDQNANKVRESRYYYDGLALGLVGKGNETKAEQWKENASYVNSQKVYNGFGLPTQEIDQRGKNINYTYDAYNLYPTTVTNHLNQATQYLYDYAFGKPKEVTNANGRKWQTIYDGLGRITEEKQPHFTSGGLTTKVKYQYSILDNGERIFKTDYIGQFSVTTAIFKDGVGRVVQERAKAEANNIYSARDLSYNSLGLLVKESVPYFSTGENYTTATTTPSLYSSYGYDAQNRVVSVSNAVGTTITAYNDWKTTTTDARGKVKRLYNDAYGNLVKVEEINGTETYTTLYDYDGNNNLAKITDALGNVRSFAYDGLSRRLTAQDLHAPEDTTFGTWTYTYDDAGNLTSVLDPKDQTINYSYDHINRLLAEDYTGQAGVEVTYAYDAGTDGKGHLTSVVKSDGLNTSYTYNTIGLVKQETKVMNGLSYTTSYTYDPQGNFLTIANPDNSVVKYDYNNAGQLERIQRKEASDQSYTDVVNNFDYGPHGKVTYQIFANGSATTNTYDEAKLYRLARKQTNSLGTVPVTTTFYPKTGDGSIYRDASTWAGAHDSGTGNAADYTSSTFKVGSGKNGSNFRIERAFLPFDTSALPDNATITGVKLKAFVESKLNNDNDGDDWVSIVQSIQNDDTILKTSNFNEAGAVSNPVEGIDISERKDITNIATGQYLEFNLNATGQGWVSKTGTTKLALREGHDAINSAVTVSSSQHNQLTIRSSEYTGTASDPVLEVTYLPQVFLQDLSYTYDANGNITKIVDASNTNSSKTVNYGYDGLNRLVFAVATNVASGQSAYAHNYSYDAIGNILTRTDAAGTYTYAGSQGSSYANPHAVTNIGSVAYTYDNNGNLLTETSGLSNTWDHNNRLSQTVKGGVTSTYAYDASGQRVKMSNGSTTTYYPSQYFNTDGTTPTKHITTPDGQNIATVKGTGQSAGVFYNHTDHLTGSSVMTNPTGGQEELLDYFPYGNMRIDENLGSFDEQRKYTGHEYDVDTGLSYMEARYYNPNIGRFLSQDPVFLAIGDHQSVQEKTQQELQEILSDPQLLNSYSYARNNPLAYVDENGEWPSWSQIKTGVQAGWSLVKPFVQNKVNQVQNSWNSYNTYMKTPEAKQKSMDAAKGGMAYVGPIAGTDRYVGFGVGSINSVGSNVSLGSRGALHIQRYHTLSGEAQSLNKSYFFNDVDYKGIITKYGNEAKGAIQGNTNIQRILDLGRPIGWDANTQGASSFMTIITDKAGQVITSHPGLPKTIKAIVKTIKK